MILRAGGDKMQIRAQSIDYAVGGFLRHRFLRSVAGSAAVLLVFALLVIGILWAIFVTLDGGNLYGVQLGMALVYAGIGAAIIALYVWQGVPRQLAFVDAMIADFRAKTWRPAFIRLGVVLAALAILATGALLVLRNVATVGAGLAVAAVLLAGVVIGLFVSTLIVAALITLFQALHRRVVAIAGLALFLLAVGVSGVPAYMLVTGYNDTASHYLLAIGGVFGALVALELAGQAWWQLTASKDGFYAVRGWRPPMQRLFTTARRHLGLPSFIANFGKDRWRLSGLYLAAAVFNAVILALIFAPVAIGMIAWDGNLLVVAAGFVIATALAWGAFMLAARFGQAAEKQAIETYQGARDWDLRAPIVFLRSFDQDSAKLKARSIDPVLHFVAGVARPQTLDEVLIEHASPYGPVIAIGDPRGSAPRLGAARVFVPGDGNEWQDVVSALVTSAKAIVMCPTTSEGVRWELNLLERHDLAMRAIYVANPELSEAENLALFQQLSAGLDLVIPHGKQPIAAFHDDEKGWRVLATRKRSLQSYIVALNFALQTLHGVKATPPVKIPKVKKEKRAKTAPTVEPAPAAV